MKTKTLVMVLCLGVSPAILGCKKEEPPRPSITAAEKAAGERAAAEKALADKAAADKAAAAKVAADKTEAEREAAAQKAAVDKALADKAAADKAAAAKAAAEKTAAEKVAADKAAAEAAAAREKAEAAALPADLVMMKSEITQALSQIDLTMAKLEVLSVTTGDLDQPSEDAVAAIEALDVATQSVTKRATDMRDRGAAYFETWEKQLAAMSTPAVAEIATKRKNELATKYAEVLTSMQESRAAFDPFWADVKSIHDTVADGLTPETQKGLAPRIKTAKDKATTLKSRVEATAAKLNQVSVIYQRP